MGIWYCRIRLIPRSLKPWHEIRRRRQDRAVMLMPKQNPWLSTMQQDWPFHLANWSLLFALHNTGSDTLENCSHFGPLNCSKVEQSWSNSAPFYIGILGHLQSWCLSLRDQIGCAGREAARHHFHDPGWIQTGHFTYPFGRMVYASGKKSAHTFKMSKSKALRFFGHAKYSSTASTKKRKSDLEPSVTPRAQIEPNSMAKRGCPHPSRTRANFSPQWNLRLPEKNAIFRAIPNL